MNDVEGVNTIRERRIKKQKDRNIIQIKNWFHHES